MNLEGVILPPVPNPTESGVPIMECTEIDHPVEVGVKPTLTTQRLQMYLRWRK